jgi:hypothetical protein
MDVLRLGPYELEGTDILEAFLVHNAGVNEIAVTAHTLC